MKDDMTDDTRDALETMAGQGVPVQGRIKGFTPLFDSIAQQHGIIAAAVFGKVWRYCQMKDRICRASLETLSAGLGIDRSTTGRHLDALCAGGYLKDLTPDLKNKPHVYKDLGKIAVHVNLTVADSNVTVAQRNVTVAQRNVTVAESNMSIESKIDSREIGATAQTIDEALGRPPKPPSTVEKKTLQTIQEQRERVAAAMQAGQAHEEGITAALYQLTGREIGTRNKTETGYITDLKQWGATPALCLHFARYAREVMNRDNFRGEFWKPTLREVWQNWRTAMDWRPREAPVYASWQGTWTADGRRADANGNAIE